MNLPANPADLSSRILDYTHLAVEVTPIRFARKSHYFDHQNFHRYVLPFGNIKKGVFRVSQYFDLNPRHEFTPKFNHTNTLSFSATTFGKPKNILIDKSGEPGQTDFGLAQLVDVKSTVTRTLDVLGTPSYMAPEQAAGNNTKLTSATDVYGPGAVLYQLLTGQPPFAGGTSIKLLLDTDPRPPRLLSPKVDRDSSGICLKCLEKDPKRRYSSALALAQDLERWLKHEPIRAKPSGLLTRACKWVRRNPSRRW
jgi:serine/threonine protein kinase